MSKLHQSEFIHQINQRWPDLRPLMNQEQDLLSFQVKHLRNLAQHYIDSHYETDLIDCLGFIDDCYRKGNSKVRDAIDVSIVEELEFRNRGKLDRVWAWNVMPAQLQKLYVAFHESPPNE